MHIAPLSGHKSFSVVVERSRSLPSALKLKKLDRLAFEELEKYLSQANRGVQVLNPDEMRHITTLANARQAADVEKAQALPPHVYVIQQVLSYASQRTQNPAKLSQLITRFLGRIQNGVNHQVAVEQRQVSPAAAQDEPSSSRLSVLA